MMTAYDKDFPSLKIFHDQACTTTHQPKVWNPTIREHDGSMKKISPTEIVLNFHTENMVSPNSILYKLDQKLSQVDNKVTQLDQGLLSL